MSIPISVVLSQVDSERKKKVGHFSFKTMAKEFNLNKWKTPNSMGGDDFGVLPKSSGIYILVHVYQIGRKFHYDVMYVGQSENLERRLISHEIKRLCEDNKGERRYIRVYFRRCAKHLLRIREKNLIKLLNPPFNLQHRVRGVM